MMMNLTAVTVVVLNLVQVVMIQRRWVGTAFS